jgi:leucine dehydrogenase
MSVYSCPDFDNHEHVSFFADEASRLRAIIAIHCTAPFGLAGGGCRMWPYASDGDALRDVLRLSRAMSYKLALCDMPAGGAKSVIIGDPKKDKTEALLHALGRAVERLGGRYIIAEDVGTTPEDMRVIGTETKYVVGRSTDTGPATAYGTFVGLRTAVERALGRTDLKGLRVAVQGVGNVGRRLCRHLVEAGADIVVTDVDERAVRAVVDELGSPHVPVVGTVRAVPPSAIYGQRVDVFAPCALGAILDDWTVPLLHCKVIAGAANNQLAEERHGDALSAKGILYAPDFVVNMGGVIGASHEGQSHGKVDDATVFRDTERIADVLTSVFDAAEKQGITPHAAAVRMAKDKIRSRRAS